MAALVTLATFPILPATQTDTTKLRTAVVVPIAEKTPEPHPKANRKIREPVPKKLVIERPPPEKLAPRELTPEKPAVPIPEPTPDPERNSDKNLVRPLRAGATSVPVLPGADRKVSTKRPYPMAAPSVTTESRPRNNQLSLSMPRLGLEDVLVGDSPDQGYLDREGIMHLSGTGFPYERGSNTYIAGHANYDASRIPSVFRNLKDLQPGDHIILHDAVGRTYDYRVYERLVVTPRDVWVTRPIPGKKIVSLQTCFPSPTFDKRLVVRGELVR
jgi:sortase A